MIEQEITDYQPGISGATETPSRPGVSNWRRLGRLIGKRPWQSGTLILILSVFTAVMLVRLTGISWGNLLLASFMTVVLLFLSVLVYRGNLQAYFLPPLPSKVDRKPNAWFSRWLGIGFGIVLANHFWKAAPPPPPPVPVPVAAAPVPAPVTPAPAGLTQEDLAKRTETYWIATVADLHQLRFGPPPRNGETAHDYDLRCYRELDASLANAQAAQTTRVDPDLVSLAQQLFELDENQLRIFERMFQMNKQYGTKPDQNPLEKSQKLGQLFADNLTDEDIEKMPQEFHELIADGLKLDEARAAQWREIELMQVRMQERYKGRHFPLPDIYQPE